MILPQFYIDDLIKNALLEDINYIDVATDYLLDENQESEAIFVAKAEGILCGADVAMRVFSLLDDSFTYTLHKKDGDLVGQMASEGTTPRRLTDLIGSLCDLTSGSGDKGTPIVFIQGYFDNYTTE